MNARDVDELASALIDGLLDEQEAAAARSDPAVLRRADEMRAGSAALREVLPLDGRRRDDIIAAALEAQDAEPATPTPQRRGRWLAVAAAVVLVLGVGGALVSQLGSSGDDRTVDVAADAPEEQGAAEDTARSALPDAAEDEAVPDLDATEEEAADGAGPAPVDLGVMASVDDLADRVGEAANRTSTFGAQPDDQLSDEDQIGAAGDARLPDCPPPAVAGAGEPLLSGVASLDDEPLRWWVVADGEVSRVVAVDTTCETVVDEVLDS